MSDKNNKMIKCEINNQEIQVKEGTSIIQAFKKLDQPIAHYCWHPGLSVAGVCRLCMVEIEGIPKLQIACNTEVKQGMKISNQSEKVKSTVRWGLEFHLINHPLDCPICDQAGECELQEQYMRFGQYSPNMAERKVKKRKVIDLGSKIVLDSERCILCSRCVRFTDEVSKTHELGIFNRGDKSEIGIFKDKPLENEYAINTVDICPVGALTAKDFRFRQRVWYLKTADSICAGCSTGCNTTVDYNEEGVFRVKPRYNQEVNSHWICDKGRELYNLPNKEGRLLQARPPASSVNTKDSPVQQPQSFLGGGVKKNLFNPADRANSIEVLKKIRKLFLKESAKQALILTAQYTVEEYEDIISFFLNYGGLKKSIYYWKNNPQSFNSFDGLLLRGDKNPNTKGLLKVLNAKQALNPWEDLLDQLKAKKIDVLWVAGPENQKAYPDLKEKIEYFEKFSKNIIWWTAHPLPVTNLQNTWQIPSKTCTEKKGTFINYAGIEQKIKAVHLFVSSALSLSESALVLKGEAPAQTKPAFLKQMSDKKSARPLLKPASGAWDRSAPSIRSDLNAMKTNYFTERKKSL